MKANLLRNALRLTSLNARLKKELPLKKIKPISRPALAANFMVTCMLFLVQPMLHAQPLLKLQDAFEMALQNNFSISVARNDAEIAKNNNQVGNAGMLPVVAGTANQDNQVVNTKQHFLTGADNNRNNAKSTLLNANIELGWTVFNGMRMFVAKERLSELQKMGDLRMRQQVETILTRVARAYYDVVLNKQMIRMSKTFIDISDKRLSTAQAKVTAGKSAKSEVLLAQVNLNADKAELIRLQTQYRNSKLSLNQLMAKEVTFDFEVIDSILPVKQMKLDDIKGTALDKNTGLLISKSNQRVNYLLMKEVKGERMPVIQLRSGYNYSRQTSEAGFLQYANNAGYHYGAGLVLNVFNGFDVNRRVNNARLMYKSSELMYKDSLNKLEVALTQAFNVYTGNIELWQFEQSNLDVARQSFSIANDQQEQGMISSNDLRIAQVSLLQNMNRLLTAAYDAKLSEVELLRLSGALFKTE